jgi:hypothetical protein
MTAWTVVLISASTTCVILAICLVAFEWGMHAGRRHAWQARRRHDDDI